MSTAEKTLTRMRSNPRDWRIEDLEVVARRHGVAVRSSGGSHVIFSLPAGAGELSVPAHRPIKPIYVKKFVAMIETLAQEE